MVARLCDSNNRYDATPDTGTNTTCGIVLEEWNIDNPLAPSLLQTIALPTTTSGSQLPCTLYPRTDDWSGSLTLSRTGRELDILCFSIEPQVGLGSASFPYALYPRVIGRLTQDGVFDSSFGIGAYDGTAQGMFNVLIDDVSSPRGYYMTGNPYVVGGVRYGILGQPNSTVLFPTGTWRNINTDGQYLYLK